MMSMVSVLLRWDGEDFTPMTATKDSLDNPQDTLIFIDENTRTLIFRMGSEVSPFEKRIVSRRFQSISKSGINLNNVQLGIGYNVIEHMGEMDIGALMKDPEKGIASLTDVKVPTSVATSRPLFAERVFDASDVLTGHNKEAYELGVKILKQIENNRTVIVKPDKTMDVYTKFL